MNAERYYRSMFHGRDESWNLRDTHMLETLLDNRSPLDDGKAKVIVWAHNSHLGDARATSMSESGESNIGQLVRERFGREVFTIGFTTYSGTVTAREIGVNEPNGGTSGPLSATAMNGSSMQRACPAFGSTCKNRRKRTYCSPKNGWSERSG